MRIGQRPRESQRNQVIAFAMERAQDSGTKVPSNFGKRRQSCQGRARYLKGKLRRWRDRTPDGQEHATCGDIEGGGKLQELFIAVLPASYKNRDG